MSLRRELSIGQSLDQRSHPLLIPSFSTRVYLTSPFSHIPPVTASPLPPLSPSRGRQLTRAPPVVNAGDSGFSATFAFRGPSSYQSATTATGSGGGSGFSSQYGSLATRHHPRTWSGIAARAGAEALLGGSSGWASRSEEAYGHTSDADGPTFGRHCEIFLNEPVGSMSISPAHRDVVLAARKGLFIIDLENPYDTPRFLPHLTTWEVADIQWSPHAARSNLLVSTSNQKLLVWNLEKAHGTAVERVLHAHTRAITDINWSAHYPDIVASCGIDTWIWTWDLRTPQKVVAGYCAWNAGATQVKYNRQDPHLLASSHDNKVLIWDDRKGSVPVTTIEAHKAKIYGIDWSRIETGKIVTCSLDKTVKLWDTANPTTPSIEMTTPTPIWRARNLPFGRGVMTLPQRGDATLSMWAFDKIHSPIMRFEGHQDVVKEYLWRMRGGADPSCDDRTFQLITWSKDQTLRLWPISEETMKEAGHVAGSPIRVRLTRSGAENITYRVPRSQPQQTDSSIQPPSSALRALVGGRSSLRSHRLSTPYASPPAGLMSTSAPGEDNGSLYGSSASAAGGSQGKRSFDHVRSHDERPSVFHRPGGHSTAPHSSRFTRAAMSAFLPRPAGPPKGFMTRGALGGAKGMGFDAVGWMQGVKLHAEKPIEQAVETEVKEGLPQLLEGSGRTGNGSRSRPSSAERPSARSVSKIRAAPDSTAYDSGGPVRYQNLGEEFAAVSKKFPAIQFEQVEVQKRTCTISLHGPWAEDGHGHSFLRITFRFPNSYPPKASGSTALPQFNLEKSGAVSSKSRTYMLRKLDQILRNNTAAGNSCLEDCIKFLLGEERLEDGFLRSDEDDAEASSESDIETGVVKQRDFLHENNQNVPIPRRCGASWGPNGELVVFFRSTSDAMPRRRRSEASPAPPRRLQGKADALFDSYNTLSNAMDKLRRIGRSISGPEWDFEDEFNLEAMETGHLLSSDFIERRLRSRTRDSRPSDVSERGWSLQRPAISISSRVQVRNFSHLMPASRELALAYCLPGPGRSPVEACMRNARVARKTGRKSLARLWKVMGSILAESVPIYRATWERRRPSALLDNDGVVAFSTKVSWGCSAHGQRWITEVLHHLAHFGDVQTLGLLSCVLLQFRSFPTQPMGGGAIGYFPGPEYMQDSFPSRGSWYPGSPVASFCGPSLPSGTSQSRLAQGRAVPSSSASRSNTGLASQSQRPQPRRTLTSSLQNQSGIESPTLATKVGRGGVPKKGSPSSSYGSSLPGPLARTVNAAHTFFGPALSSSHSSGGGDLRASPSDLSHQSSSARNGPEETSTSTPAKHLRLIPAGLADEEEKGPLLQPIYVPLLDAALAGRFECQRLAYAEQLYRWGLLEQRTELLCLSFRGFADRQRAKAVLNAAGRGDFQTEALNISWLCSNCGSHDAMDDVSGRLFCADCDRRQAGSVCSICHGPITGSSRSCLSCLHETHATCAAWYFKDQEECPAGCGCSCEGGSSAVT